MIKERLYPVNCQGQLRDRRRRGRAAALTGLAVLVLPGEGQRASTGQVGQAGFRAKQTRRPWRMSRWLAWVQPGWGRTRQSWSWIFSGAFPRAKPQRRWARNTV